MELVINGSIIGCLPVLRRLHHLLFGQLCNSWCILQAAVINLDKGQFSKPVGAGALKPLGRNGDFKIFSFMQNSCFPSFVKLPTSQTVLVWVIPIFILASVSSQLSWKATEIRHFCRIIPSINMSIFVFFETNHQTRVNFITSFFFLHDIVLVLLNHVKIAF